MDLNLALELDALEVHDLGKQIYRATDGEEFLGFVTVAFWRCRKCGDIIEVHSVLERRFAIATLVSPSQLPVLRLGHDRATVTHSKDAHRCLGRQQAAVDAAPNTVRVVDAERPD